MASEDLSAVLKSRLRLWGIYSTGILIFFNWGRREERGRKRETGKREGMAGFKLVWKKTKWRRVKGERSVVRERKSVVEKGRDFWFWGKNVSVEEERGGEAISLTPVPALFLPFQPNHSFTFCTYARWKASRVSNVIMTMLEHIDQRARGGGDLHKNVTNISHPLIVNFIDSRIYKRILTSHRSNSFVV